MHKRSFLHPDDAYRDSEICKNQQQAPDIFVVPPEEDQTPPWCCYNSQQGLADDDDDDEEDDHTLRYQQASCHTPYFHGEAPGFEGLIMPSRKGSGETKSIVDALGDADDDSDGELDHEDIGMYLGENQEKEGDETVSEMGINRRRVFHQPLSPHQEVGSDNDSDVVEIVKVRRKSAFVADDPDFFGPSGSGFGSSKSTLRSRATKAFQSFKGTLGASSKSTPKLADLAGTSYGPDNKAKSLKLRARSLSKRTRAQDVFSPIVNIPISERSQTPVLSRRPSSSLSQFFSPALRRRASSSSITATPRPATPPLQTRTPLLDSSLTKSKSILSHKTTTRPRSRSSAQTRGRIITSEADGVPTPTGTSHDRSEDDQSTPWWGPRDTDIRGSLRSTSPTPPPCSESPPPNSRPARKPFSVLSLHKLFKKSGAPNASDPLPQPTNQAPSTSSAASTCPSLSSTPTSEWSGRTSPTLDSTPQTPTSFDENETRRTIVPVESRSTVGSGISLGSSLQSTAISDFSSSSISSAATAATRGSISSDREYFPAQTTGTVPLKTAGRVEPVFCPPTTADLNAKTSQPSISVSRSTVSTSTAGGARYIPSSRVSDTTISSPAMEVPQEPNFNISLKLDLDLDLGLGINLTPSQSGGMLSSNNMKKPMANSSTFKHRRGPSLARNIRLKNIGSRLGIGKQEIPPVPPLPQPGRTSTESGKGEMKLNSMHFEDISFDVNDFIAD